MRRTSRRIRHRYREGRRFLADNEEAVWALVAAWGAFKVASIAQGFITLATNIGTATTALTAMKAEMLAADGPGAAGGAGLLGSWASSRSSHHFRCRGIPDQGRQRR